MCWPRIAHQNRNADSTISEGASYPDPISEGARRNDPRSCPYRAQQRSDPTCHRPARRWPNRSIRPPPLPADDEAYTQLAEFIGRRTSRVPLCRPAP
jgi:hypothetical protein